MTKKNNFLDTPLLYDGEEINEFLPYEFKSLVRVLEEEKTKATFQNLEEKFDEVLEKPVGYSKSLEKIISDHYRENGYILILVDDNTRPNVHTKILLPLLLNRLVHYGVIEEHIHIMFASGTHRPPTNTEQLNILGSKIWKQYQKRLHVHNCDEDCIDLGIRSSSGTPIIINEKVMNSDLVIPLTDSELHYFAGVAGTIKELIPGVASRKTINRNHVKIFDREHGFKDSCRLGNIKGNPMISDIKDMVSKISEKVPIFGVDSIFSLRLNEIVYLNAGDIVKLHEEASQFVISIRTVEIRNPADLVIVSAKQLGLNLYQSGKAVHAAWQATKRGGKGKILVLAPCKDAVGNDSYHNIMEESRKMPPEKAMQHVISNYCTEETFKIGNQKPVDLFRILQSIGESNIYYLTEMNDQLLRNTFRINKVQKSQDEGAKEALRRFINENIDRVKSPSIYLIPDPGILITLEDTRN